MSNPMYKVILAGQDDLSPAIDQAKNSLDGLGKKVGENSTLSQKFTDVIRSERGEHRMRAFAIREGAGAVGELSDIMVGPSGLSKALSKSTSQLFEMDFALNALGAVGQSAGGMFGKIATSLASVAIPASLAVGAFALIKNALDEGEKAEKANTEEVRKLNEQLGLVPVDKLAEIKKKTKEAVDEAKQGAPWYERLWTGMKSGNFMFGAVIADVKDMEKVSRTALSGAVETVKVTKEDLVAKQSVYDLETKLLDVQIKGQAGELGGVENLNKRLGLEKLDLGAMEDLYRLEQKTNLDRESAIEKRARLLKIEIQIASMKDQIKVDASFTKAITEPVSKVGAIFGNSMKVATPTMQKVFSQLNSGFKTTQEFADKNMAKLIEGFKEEAKVFDTWVGGPLTAGIDVVGSEISSAMGGAFDSVFGQANSLLEKFTKAILQSMAEIAGKQLATAGVAGLLSIIPGVGLFSTLFKSLGGIFHSGGTVPRAHSGAYVNADPSKEFPILVRGGETIRTEGQERSLRSSMSPQTTIHLNIGTAIGGAQFVRDALSELRRQTGLSLDTLTQNRSAVVSIADTGR